MARRKGQTVRRYPALWRSPLLAVRYLFFDHELDNFTYEISNRDEISSLLAGALGLEPSVIRGYIEELDADHDLRHSIEQALAARRDRNRSMPYGAV